MNADPLKERSAPLHLSQHEESHEKNPAPLLLKTKTSLVMDIDHDSLAAFGFRAQLF